MRIAAHSKQVKSADECPFTDVDVSGEPDGPYRIHTTYGCQV